MKRLVFAVAAALAIAAPVSASSLANLAITSSQPGTVSSGATFAHSFTVTNIGGSAGVAQVHDSFSTTFEVVALDNPDCSIAIVMVKMRRQQAGVVCNLASIEPGRSVTITETLRAKFTSWSGSVVVNRNHNVELESNYADNSAYWAVTVR